MSSTIPTAPTSTGGNTIGVTATQSMDPGAKGSFTEQLMPIGNFHRIIDKTGEAYEVDIIWRGKSVGTLDLENKVYPEKLKEDLGKMWEGVTGYVKKKIDPKATEIKISLKTLIAKYTRSDGEIRYLDLSKPDGPALDPDLLKLMTSVQRAAKKIWQEMRFHDTSSSGNRTTDGSKPLEITTDRWLAAMPHSMGQFFTQGHFEEVCNMHSTKTDIELQREGSLKKIVAAEAFVHSLTKKVKDQIAEIEAEQKKTPSDPKIDKEKLKEDLQALRKLQKELEEIDRLAVYFAVGVWGAAPSELSPAERIEKANLISNGVHKVLTGKLKPGHDPRETGNINWIKKQLGIGKKDAETFMGLGPDVAAYAGDAGGLALHEKIQYIEWTEQDGSRVRRRPSVAEFVVHNTIHMGDKPEAFKIGEALDSLGITLSETTGKKLTENITEARTKAEDVAGEVPSTGTLTNPKAVLSALEQVPDIKPFIGEK